MANTNIENLKKQLEATVVELKKFDDFRSPVNYSLLSLTWDYMGNKEIIKVSVLDSTGHFYRGRIVGRATNGPGDWNILADDGELVRGVLTTSFVGVRLEVER